MSLSREIDDAITLYESKIGGFAARTRQMIEHHGKTEALAKLVESADLQRGFRILRDAGHLDSTFEALIIRHQTEFRESTIDAARWRLKHATQLSDIDRNW